MGKNEYGESGPFVYFHSFEALNDAFEVFRASFLRLTKDTDTIYDHAAQIFFKWNIVKQCL